MGGRVLSDEEIFGSGSLGDSRELKKREQGSKRHRRIQVGFWRNLQALPNDTILDYNKK